MSKGTVSYTFPNGAKAPTQAQMADKNASAVHATVVLPEGATSVDITHNMQFDPDAPPEALQEPVVNIIATSAGAAAGLPIVSYPDGNTVRISKGTVGAGTDATFSVKILKHPGVPAKPADKPAAKA